MAVEVKILSRIISVKNSLFHPEDVYKTTKEKIEALGYTFFEKKHKSKKTQYGTWVYVEFYGIKNRDDFSASRLEVTFTFSDLKPGTYEGKNISQGNCSVVVSCHVIFDKENKYKADPFKNWLFGVYSKTIGRSLLKKKYIVPTVVEYLELYAYIKEKLYLYA